MSTAKSELFWNIGEPFAAGLFENEDKCPTYRYSNAYRRFWENATLTPYDGRRLYPCGENIRRNSENASIAIVPDYSFTYEIRWPVLKGKSEKAFDMFLEEHNKVYSLHGHHFVGGAGYTHCFPNYKRIISEGIKGIEKRVITLPDDDFKEGLLILIEGIRTYHKRCIELLVSSNANPELIAALQHVPENPPRNIYEALVSWNFIYYIDGCDDIGALDRNLLPWYKGEDITDLLRELFSHVDINDGWSGPLGPNYNEITVQCIKAIANGRRPNLQLLVRKDMPDEIWEASYASIGTSCGQPAFYNYDLYISKLKELMPHLTNEDLSHLAFGGCTETMLEGISSVGSDDAGINTAYVFDRYMREKLQGAKTFDEFYSGLCGEISKTVVETLNMVNEYRRTRALYRSQPVHTLFVDDCIANRKDFNNGGPRHHWSVSNVAGLINVIDSLLVVRELVFKRKTYTAHELIEKLDSRDLAFLQDAKTCPAYGRDDDEADNLAADFADKVYSSFSAVPCYPCGHYYPVSNQFTTYAAAGWGIRATPDGRDENDPLCDSMGAIHGNDTKGPTALLNSVAKLPLSKVIGTPIMNIRIRKENLKLIKPLVRTFFEKGGMQLQVSCLSREEILDAMAHPEKHEKLVVRIGGFSEYFIWLGTALQKTVLERTEY